jgi:CheY-like chemotaxis protein
MDAIGRLAAGVAHDFNNLLSVIVGYAQVVRAELPRGGPLAEYVQEIHTAGLRAAQLTKQLLAFGRRQALSPRVVDLSEVVQDMGRMLARIIGEDVELRLVPADGAVLCHVDPHQIEQVVMNLVVNARDALPSGGTITVTTKSVRLDEDFARSHHGVTAGPHVALSVADTGVGMSPETQARVFEPFFTTKDGAGGTGLGLATVFGIVQQSGGTIWIDSAIGRGTTFTLYFPQAREDAKADPASAPAVSKPVGGHETILLVEDDPQVRVLVERVLHRQGYKTLSAESAASAVRLSQELAGDIDLLLTDVVLRDTSGPELAAVLGQQRPRMKTLFMSGYAASRGGARTVEPRYGEVVPKPVNGDVLAARVRAVLDAASPTSDA